MDASEGSVNRIGRSIWTVWGYLTGAVARYLRPEVTNEGNQNVYSATDDSVLRSTTKYVDRQVTETDAEKEQREKYSTQNEENKAGVKSLLPEARIQVATAQWEKTDVVNEDSNKLAFDIPIRQSHEQTGDIITQDVQKNIENEQKQTISEAYIENEAASSDGSLAEYASNKGNIDFKRGGTEQNLNETEDIEQKDGYNEDTKEESDHYNEDDGKTCVMKREDSDGTDVTIQSVLYEQDLQEINLINKLDYKETEDTRTECTKDQERTENDEDEDEESESIEEDEDLLLKLVCSTEDEAELPKQFESEKLMEKSSENSKHEDIQTPERQVDIISKNVVEMPETRGTNEQGKRIEGHEQCRLIDSVELANTDIFSKKEACDKTQSQLEPEETLPKLSKQIFEENVTCNELELKTTTVVSEGVDKTFNACTMQSDSSELSVQCSPETGNLLPFVATENYERFVHELPGEPRKGPEMGSLNSGALDQITEVATSLGSFEEIKANIHEPPILADEQSQRENVVTCSKLELNRTSLNDTLVEESEFEPDIIIPVSSVEFGTKQIQTLKEIAKQCVELKTDLLIEAIKRDIDNEAKAEDFMTASEQDIGIFEPNIEKECTAMDTLSESLKEGKWDSSIEIKRKELDEEDNPDVTEAKSELCFFSPAEVLKETLDLQDKSERCAEQLENMKPEVRLLGKAESLATVESVEEMINQILKETLEMEFQRPTECLPTCVPLLEEEKELLGDTVESLGEMVVEAEVSEAVKKQNDQPNVSSPKCEVTDVDGGFKLLERTAEETQFRSNDSISDISQPGLKRRFDDMNKDLPRVKDQNSPLLECSTTDDLNIKQTSLDFSVQKSRIGVKNPLVRPPKDPRKLLNKISVEPSLSKPPPCELLKGGQGVAVSLQSKGVIGFKLPGMVPELPTLRKTEFGKKVREDEKAESTHQKEQKIVAETENSVKQEQALLKPKWTPPRHPGIGSPLMMAELKSKLKTHVKE